MDASLGELPRALPDTFSFYHLGQVSRVSGKSRLGLEGAAAIAYSIRGDWSGELVLLFPLNEGQDLEESMYSEMGNVLASRLASAVSTSADVILAPPRRLDASQLRRIGNGRLPDVDLAYVHEHGGVSVPLAVWVFVGDLAVQRVGQEVGHA